ncbi:MAG: hypothetical protein ACRD3Q_16850 [Terriglobales bacterium]
MHTTTNNGGIMTTESEPRFESPILTNVEPNYGKVGDLITIEGRHLAPVTSATFTIEPTSKDSRTQNHEGDVALQTTVPVGVNAGNGTVTVTSPGGTSKPYDFTVLS